MRFLRVLLLLVVLGTGLSGALLYHDGYRLYVIHTGSMVPTYRPGDLLIDRPAPARAAVGQPITFAIGPGEVVTHRVVSVSPAGLIRTKGDANATADAWTIKPDMVRGSVVRPVHGAGYLVVFLRQPSGLAALASTLLAVYLLWNLFFDDATPAAAPDPASRRSSPARHAARGARPAPAGFDSKLSDLLG